MGCLKIPPISYRLKVIRFFSFNWIFLSEQKIWLFVGDNYLEKKRFRSVQTLRVSPHIASSIFKAFWTPPLVINRHHALNPLTHRLRHHPLSWRAAVKHINHLAHGVYKSTTVTI
jgi:hypothetical protein